LGEEGRGGLVRDRLSLAYAAIELEETATFGTGLLKASPCMLKVRLFPLRSRGEEQFLDLRIDGLLPFGVRGPFPDSTTERLG
jgi:hypothetical protein